MTARPLAQIVPDLVRRSGKGRFAALADLMAAWDVLVAGMPAASCVPEKLSFPRGDRGGATLTLAVFSSAEALAVQHEEPRLIERVNQHFGYAAVARVALVHRPPQSRGKPGKAARKGGRAQADRPLAASEAEAIDHIVATVGDDRLREQLARLGRSLYRRSASGPNGTDS